MTGCWPGRSSPRSMPAARCSPTTGMRRRSPTFWPGAARSRCCPRRWRRSTSRSGTWPAGARASRCGGCSGSGRAGTVAVNARSPPPTGPGPPSEAAQARVDGFTTVKVKVGDRRRRRAAGRSAGVCRTAHGDPNRRQRRLVTGRGAGDARGARAGGDRAVRGAGRTGSKRSVDAPAGHRRAAGARRVCGRPEALLAPPAADLVCLKLARCGGITGTIQAAERARAAGYRVYLASTLDGPLGIAGALHAAAVIRPDAGVRAGDPGAVSRAPDPLPPLRGVMSAPSTPGLGEA